MEITNLTSNNATIKELGLRIRALRVESQLTQAELASRAGVSLKTISNLESGCDIKLDSLISVIRALGQLSRLNNLLPDENLRQAQLAVLNAKPNKPRQRVRSKFKTALNYAQVSIKAEATE